MDRDDRSISRRSDRRRGDEVERPEPGEDDPALMAPRACGAEDRAGSGNPGEPRRSRPDLRADRQARRHRLCRDDADHARLSGRREHAGRGRRTAIRRVPGVNDVRVKLVWTPPWVRERMSEEAKLELGLM